MYKRKLSSDSPLELVEPARLTPLERHVLSDLGARLAMARALSNADNPAAFSKAIADDLEEFLVLHKVTGVDAERRQEAHDFLLQSAQEFVAACAQHPAAFEPAATAPRRTKR
jgi:hypothetical protein